MSEELQVGGPDELQRSLGRVESKVDILLERSEAIDRRVSSVEKKVWWLTGIGAAIAFLGAKFTNLH